MPHDNLDSQEFPVEAERPDHLILPFDLRRDPGGFYNPETSRMLFEIFSLDIISFNKRFLRLCMKSTLPPKPWPRTIAGVPAYFTNDPEDEGPSAPIKRFSSSCFSLHNDLDYRYNPAKKRPLFELVKKYFVAVARIKITDVQNWRNVVVIVLENDDTDMTVVPTAMASCPCNYLFESEMGRQKGPNENGRNKKRRIKKGRNKKPRVDVYDDSEYPVLRPGIMLSSGKNELSEDEVRTTAGILVKDNMGNKYMTVASSAFPHGSRVFHPDMHGREIGETVKKLSNTDITLVRLHDGETFTNEFFQSLHMLRSPPPQEGFKRAEELILVEFVYMDNAFAGYREGTVGFNAFTRVPADGSLGSETDWTETRWDYMGQGFSEHYVDGARGSVIWDGDGMVLGFFRFAPVSGHFVDWCQSVPAGYLIDSEYTVV